MIKTRASVRAVESERDFESFFRLPWKIYRDDPMWVPPMKSSARNELKRETNPFLRHCDYKLFILERDGKVEGRIAALVVSGAAVIGHETKPLVVANIAGGATVPLPVAFDTQIAAYLLNASLRSQTIADVAHERLDVTLPPAGDVPPAVQIGLDAPPETCPPPSRSDSTPWPLSQSGSRSRRRWRIWAWIGSSAR